MDKNRRTPANGELTLAIIGCSEEYHRCVQQAEYRGCADREEN